MKKQITIIFLIVLAGMLFVACPEPVGEYELNISTTGSGSVVKDPNQALYEENSIVTLTATPNTGYVFDHWSGDLTGTTNPANITMNSDKNITANFVSVANWTIMVYLDADNNLEPYGIEDLNEMEGVDLAGEGINVIVLIDRIPGHDTTNGDWRGTRLYEVEYDSLGKSNVPIVSTRLASTELGLSDTGDADELNMGNPATVTDFIDFCKSDYPAENYFLIFWNHGGGWRTRSEVKQDKEDFLRNLAEGNITASDYLLKRDETGSESGYRAVCWDETDGDDRLYTKEVGTSIAGQGIDVVGFDACLEGMIEVAYEIKDDASYMIASEETEGGDGWEYDVWLNNLISSSGTPLDLVDAVVDAYAYWYSGFSGATLSGVDLSKIDPLMTAFNNFSLALYNATINSTIQASIRSAIWNADYYWGGYGHDYNVDIWDMANEIQTQYDYADTEAIAVKNAVDNAVVAEWHHSSGHPNAHGIAIHYHTTIYPDVFTAHWYSYMKNNPYAYPLAFVNDSANKWVMHWNEPTPIGPGLLYRLFYESF